MNLHAKQLGSFFGSRATLRSASGCITKTADLPLVRCIEPCTTGRLQTCVRRCPRRRYALRATADGGQLDLLEDLNLPDTIDGDLRSYEEEAGAEFSDNGVPLTFNNDSEAAEALSEGAVVVDRSHWGRIRVGGEDRATFLHGQSTADFTTLQPGQGCDTVFVTAQGRCVDLATCLVQPSGILCIVSPCMTQTLLQRLDKYIFFGDKVELLDISSKTAMLTLAGPQAADVLSALDADAAARMQPGQHMLFQCGGGPVIVAASRSLGQPDYIFVADEAVAGELWRSLTAKGAVPMGEYEWQRACTLAGRPQVGVEMTEEMTPLEAGLYGAVSLNKGCYIGQEALAKVHAKGIAKQLSGMRLTAPASASTGDAVLSDGEQIGKVSSAVEDGSGCHFALAYLRCRRKGEQIPLIGKQVEVNGAAGIVEELPFLQRQFAPGTAPQVAGKKAAAEKADTSTADDKKAAEEAAKQERLKAMQERLAAWQAQQ